jgi:hypothetical protein
LKGANVSKKPPKKEGALIKMSINCLQTIAEPPSRETECVNDREANALIRYQLVMQLWTVAVKKKP